MTNDKRIILDAINKEGKVYYQVQHNRNKDNHYGVFYKIDSNGFIYLLINNNKTCLSSIYKKLFHTREIKDFSFKNEREFENCIASNFNEKDSRYISTYDELDILRLK